MPGAGRDLLEPMRAVVSSPREDLHRRVGDVDLDPVAVELDFVNPAFPTGRLLNRRGQGGLDESGEGRLQADRRRAFC